MLYDYAMILNMQTDKKIADEIRDFFKIDGNVRDDIKDTIKKSIERIDSNITFLKSNR
jgi:archaellum component FlaC